jgi:tRNA pseudouridine55 synthase
MIILDYFSKEYNQVVPILSSVKINGEKLRVLTRSAEKINYLSPSKVEFVLKSGNVLVVLPTRSCKIHEYKIKNISSNSISASVKVSKGTYIRKLGEDIAERLGTYGYLTYLRRTSI